MAVDILRDETALGNDLQLFVAEVFQRGGDQLPADALSFEFRGNFCMRQNPVARPQNVLDHGFVAAHDMMHVPVLGIVENMAYYTCPDCGKQHAIFGESHIEAIAAKHGIPNTAKLPIDPAIAAACDAGKIEDVQGDWLSSLADAIEGK